MSDSQTPIKLRPEMMTSTPASGSAKRDEQRLSIDVEKVLSETKKCLEQQESTCRALTAQKKDDQRVFDDKIRSLEDSLTDVRAQNIRLGSRVQYAEEKEKLLLVIHNISLPVANVELIF